MNPDASNPRLEGCEAVQRQLSESADAGLPLTPGIETHLRSCDGCRQFARTWFPQPPAVLVSAVNESDGGRLREHILEAAARPEVIPFPTAPRRASWATWAGRVAACLALGGLAWSLLNPTPSLPKARHVAGEPTLAQSFAQVEDRTKHEQRVLQTALVDGGQRVHGDVEWTLSALEL